MKLRRCARRHMVSRWRALGTAPECIKLPAPEGQWPGLE